MFNPTLGNDFDDSDRILYFFPNKNTDINSQCHYVGLVSGLINFTKLSAVNVTINILFFILCKITFNMKHINETKSNRGFSSTPGQSLTTEKNRLVFIEVEKDIWVALALKNPRKPIKNQASNSPQQTTNDHKNDDPKLSKSDTLATRDEYGLPLITSNVYMESEFNDNVLLTILKSAHATFVFFHGPIINIIEKEGYDRLRKKLLLFFEYYLPTIQFSQLRYFSDLFGFSFLGVNRKTYFTLRYFSNNVMDEYPQLHSLSIMYNDKLILSGMSQQDMKVLYTINQQPCSSYIYTFMAKYQTILSQESINTYTNLSKQIDNQENEKKTNNNNNGNNNNNKTNSHNYYRDSATAAQETKYQTSKPKYNITQSETAIAPEILEKIRNICQSMSGKFIGGPLSMEYYSQEIPVVYIAQHKRFYRMVCYQLAKLTLIWLMDDATLKQPTDGDCNAFDGKRKNGLKKGDSFIGKNFEEKDKENVKHNKYDNLTRSEQLFNSFGPLADDMTAKYFSKPKKIATKFEQNGISTDDYSVGKRSIASLTLQENILFYQKLNKFIESQCEEINKNLENNLKKNEMQSDSFRYLYFNHENLALKAELKAHGKKLSTNSCQTLKNIRRDFKREGMRIADVCAKCPNGWVGARKSYFGRRELYLFLDDNEALDLIDVQDRMDSLQRTYFTNFFMH